MSTTATHENIARLLTTFSFEIYLLPDDLKCGECKYVLKDACQVPCGCRFCRTCIDNLIANGAQFCSSSSQHCGRTPLSTAVPDYRANMSISKLTSKCPLLGCSHECPLADMEGHLQECPRKSVYCPFRELGCQQDKLTAEEINGHMQLKSLSHSQILIEMVSNNNREMEVLMLDNEANKAKIEMLEREVVLKDEQMKTIIDELRNVQNENKSIKEEMKSIKDENKSTKDKIESINQEKEVIFDRVRQLSEKLERETNERRESHERDSTRITATAETIGSNWDALETGKEPVKEDIRPIKCNIDPLKGLVKSTQVAEGLEMVDASCYEWVIDVHASKEHWNWGWNMYSEVNSSDEFKKVVQPHIYQLASGNCVSAGELNIRLCMRASQSDALLDWPFRGKVSVTVANKDRRASGSRQTRLCRIERPPDNQCSLIDPFIFSQSALRAGGLDLKRPMYACCGFQLGGS